MIFLVSILFWLTALAVVFRLLRIGSQQQMSRAQLVALLVLLASAALLFFRPHEPVLAGQDPGVYVNAAATFARQGRLFYKDEMLAQVPREDRQVFLFGHRQYGQTKDSCLKITDIDKSLIGPEFQPLYPVVMSLIALAGPPTWPLYVAPLFALFTVVTLYVLGGQLLDSKWGGVLASVFYISSPLVVWHARAPRPEIMAGFLLFSGCSLLVHAWQGVRWHRWHDVILGSFCISLAPFFHPTAWFVAIPLCIPVLAAIASGRSDYLIHPVVALASLVVFCWHTLHLADHYSLSRFILPVMDRPWLMAASLACLAAALAAAYFVPAHLRKHATGRAMPQWLSWWKQRISVRLLAVVSVSATYVWLYLRRSPLSQRSFSEPEYHYLFPTDLRVVVEFISLPIALLALAGLGVMIASRARGIIERRVFLLCILPATWLIGNMYGLFMTRYMMTTMMPLMALSLAALLALIPLRRRIAGGITLLAAALIVVLLMAHQRTQLIRSRDFKGLIGFMEQFADRIHEKDGILLSEYSRAGAPFEHLFGVPSLGFDNTTRFNYSRGMAAWETIARNNPDRPPYFLTPFAAPVSDRFLFRPVYEDTLEYDRLTGGRFDLPNVIRTGDIALSLYAMELSRGHLPSFPYVRTLDASNMGLRNFSRSRVKDWSIKGMPLRADTPSRVELPPEIARDDNPRMLLFFFCNRAQDVNAPEVVLPDADKPDTEWIHLVHEWWALVLHPESEPNGNRGPLTLIPDDNMLLTDILLTSESGSRPVRISSTTTNTASATGAAFAGRWARAESGLLAPVPEDGRLGHLLVLMKAPDETGPLATISMRTVGAELAERKIPTGIWTWQAWPLRGAATEPGFTWVSMSTVPPWDPNLDKYPHDLGVRVGAIAVICLDAR